MVESGKKVAAVAKTSTYDTNLFLILAKEWTNNSERKKKQTETSDNNYNGKLTYFKNTVYFSHSILGCQIKFLSSVI